jgi:two-component system cell cycle response regulator DivK
VELAVDGQQGLAALMARSYDLVLCDIDMPNLDGLNCIRQLRAWEEEHRAHKRQTVFCMTGEDKISDEDIKEAGMSEVMRKPYTMQKIKELKELLTVGGCPPAARASAEENNAVRHELESGTVPGLSPVPPPPGPPPATPHASRFEESREGWNTKSVYLQPVEQNNAVRDGKRGVSHVCILA